MRKIITLGFFLFLATTLLLAVPDARQEQAPPGDRQAISYDRWLAAKERAERYAREGKYVEALQHYLEYTRQAEGLGSPRLVAWGKNNAAYMIIRMHMQDATVDLVPAKKLLEEGLAIEETSEDCRKLLGSNLEYVKRNIGRTA